VISIALTSALAPESRALIDQSERLMRSLFSVDECYTFSAEELANDKTDFFIAHLDGAPVGCVALVDCGNYAEIKRLYVSDTARGSGVALQLMAALEKRAVSGIIRLETTEKLDAAVSFYEKLGYTRIAAFGDYTADASSVFMEKRLS